VTEKGVPNGATTFSIMTLDNTTLSILTHHNDTRHYGTPNTDNA
jgi:hypothetical protein